ncbi:YggS family pyridoxal phosphate-dependent enzyme [Arthrobacter echini]|uniref:Pyridoxal phosphate homeostasis protein n=1 Tax=Arthrobacter echini TaxID=1529066 RepID=A0A4S5E7T4_9MICC|nr:YggS family pyridoxal phosphate-dependent enzyme [Arthrobacter echini]THJ67540.1 YggS family pyridoxal phosphate-dependent enzyme [Arthrobacter echini]
MIDPGAQEGPAVSDARARELAARLQHVRERISSATAAAGRTRPTLIVVTKYFPVSDIRILHGLGVHDVGENRDQEASGKAAELGDLLTWHFIGQLQTNKARSVVRYAAAVHSVDRLSLVRALGKAVAAEQEGRAASGAVPRADLECFLQFDLDPEASDGGRGGALPGEALALAEALMGTPGLRLAGVMAVAPLGIPPSEAFGNLASISGTVRSVDPTATGISAGMSGDLEEAVEAGATHLRIGSDVLGPRPEVR